MAPRANLGRLRHLAAIQLAVTWLATDSAATPSETLAQNSASRTAFDAHSEPPNKRIMHPLPCLIVPTVFGEYATTEHD